MDRIRIGEFIKFASYQGRWTGVIAQDPHAALFDFLLQVMYVLLQFKNAFYKKSSKSYIIACDLEWK